MKKFILILTLVITQTVNATNKIVELYVGEPLGEACYDLLKSGATIIATPILSKNTLVKFDSFVLMDGKIVFLESKTTELGQKFTISRIGIFSKIDIKSIELEKIRFVKSFSSGE